MDLIIFDNDHYDYLKNLDKEKNDCFMNIRCVRWLTFVYKIVVINKNVSNYK